MRKVENIVKIAVLVILAAVEEENGEQHTIPRKERIRAAQIANQSIKELVFRLCGLRGLFVNNIGEPERWAITGERLSTVVYGGEQWLTNVKFCVLWGGADYWPIASQEL